MKIKNLTKVSIISTLIFATSIITSCDKKPEQTEQVGVKTKQELLNSIENKETTITLGEDIAIDSAIIIDYAVTVNLNDKTISIPNDTVGDGVFHVIEGGKLTINGEGTVNGASSYNDYGMCIWADGGNVTINGGTYTNVGTKSNEDSGALNNNEVIYAKNGSVVTINKGTFIGNNTRWTLNNHDKLPGTFVVKGGTFKSFNPYSTNTEPEGANNNFIAQGYKISIDGEWFSVVEE